MTLKNKLQIAMSSRRWLELLHRSGWEFWLPLPFIAGLVWLIGNQIVAQVLVQPHEAIETLQANSDIENVVWAINVQIDRTDQTAKVFVRTIDSSSKTLEYKFSTAEVSEIERAIAENLKIPVAEVRKIASYRIQK